MLAGWHSWWRVGGGHVRLFRLAAPRACRSRSCNRDLYAAGHVPVVQRAQLPQRVGIDAEPRHPEEPWLLAGLLLGNLLQFPVIYTEPMNRVFHTDPIPLADFFFIGAVASLVLWAEEARKYLARRRAREAFPEKLIQRQHRGSADVAMLCSVPLRHGIEAVNERAFFLGPTWRRSDFPAAGKGLLLLASLSARRAKPGCSRIAFEVILHIEGRTKKYQTLILDVGGGHPGAGYHIGFPADF